MPQITIDLDDATAGQLDAICADYAVTPSQLVARSIRRLSALIAQAPHQDRATPTVDAPWIDALLPNTRGDRG